MPLDRLLVLYAAGTGFTSGLMDIIRARAGIFSIEHQHYGTLPICYRQCGDPLQECLSVLRAKQNPAMSAKAQGVNIAVVRQCREQMGLQPAEVEAIARIKNYAACESGDKQLTYRQLGKLADLYEVDRWVLRSDQLPEDYQFAKQIPAFDQFKRSPTKLFADYKLRGLLARVVWMRGDIQELRVDWQEPVARFKPPKIGDSTSATDAASKVRSWLGATGRHDFSWWRDELESKGVFTFVTSNSRGKSYLSPEHFRGLAVCYDLLPIIIINGAGRRKSKSTTLLYELGHLLRKEHSIDGWQLRLTEDSWCEEFANNMLMPIKEIKDVVSQYPCISLHAVSKIAKNFNVSNESCLDRMKQTQSINRAVYSDLKRELDYHIIEKLGRRQTRLSAAIKSKSGNLASLIGSYPKTLRSEEQIKKQTILSERRIAQSLEQYGQLYACTLFNAWSEDDIKLTTLRDALGLQSLEQARALRHILR